MNNFINLSIFDLTFAKEHVLWFDYVALQNMD